MWNEYSYANNHIRSKGGLVLGLVHPMGSIQYLEYDGDLTELKYDIITRVECGLGRDISHLFIAQGINDCPRYLPMLDRTEDEINNLQGVSFNKVVYISTRGLSNENIIEEIMKQIKILIS